MIRDWEGVCRDDVREVMVNMNKLNIMSENMQEKAKARAFDYPAPLLPRIEPGVAERPALETQIFLASIAISLKRIADLFEKLDSLPI